MSSTPLRIAYFGLPLGALALHQAGFTPALVVLGHPDAPGARRVRKRLGGRTLILGRPNLEDPSIRALVARVRPDVLLSWFWPKQIPEAVLRLSPRGAFGVHPSLLPRWRGPDPYFWAIVSGDPETGVSLHRLEREYDTGNVIAQTKVPIPPRLNAWTLAKRMDTPSLRLLLEAARRLSAGEDLLGLPQDEARATAAPQPTDDLLELDWQEPADAVVRRVRALSPYPGAGAQLGDEAVEVLTARRYDAALPRALEPGDAVATEQGVVIRTKDAGVLVERVRCENGETLRGAEIEQLFPEGLFRLERLRSRP